MKNRLLILLFGLALNAHAEKPTGCDANSFKFEVAGQDLQVKRCFFTAAQDGEYFGKSLKAKTRYVGLFSVEKDDWLVEPVHQDVAAFKKDRVLTLGPGEKFYQYYTVQTRQFTASPITAVRPVLYATREAYSLSNVFEIDGDASKLALYDQQDGTIRRTLEGVDRPIARNPKEPIEAIYSSRHGGYIVRHLRADGSKFYAVYSDAGNALTPEIPAEQIYPTKVEIANGKGWIPEAVMFFERIDPQKNLYWPVQFDGERTIAKPENFRGIRMLNQESNAGRLTFSTEYVGEFTDSRYLSYQRGQLPEQLDDRVAFFTDQSKKLLETSVEEIPERSGYGNYLTQHMRVLVLEDGIELPRAKKLFKDRAELMAFIAEEKERMLVAAQEKKVLAEKAQVAKLAADRQAAAVAKAQSPAPAPAQPLTKAQAFINYIHESGPNRSSLQAFYYDVGVYCQYRGPRCSEFQALYRSMENDHNRGVAWNNQQRLNGVYNKDSGSSSSGRTSATTDRYNSAVKSAAEKERVRIRDEQWKKK